MAKWARRSEINEIFLTTLSTQVKYSGCWGSSQPWPSQSLCGSGQSGPYISSRLTYLFATHVMPLFLSFTFMVMTVKNGTEYDVVRAAARFYSARLCLFLLGSGRHLPHSQVP